jgi:spermidine/putrescine transport system substrate-binding protein
MVEGLKSEPGKFDVFLVEDGYIPILAGKRMMRPLDHRKLPHWKNLAPNFINQHFDPKNEFSSPYLWGTTLLAYRKDLLPSPKPSWSLIFDPALKNRVSLLDDMMECYAGALRTMGIDNLSEAKPDEISAAADALTKLVKENYGRFGGLSGNEVKQHLLEGSSWVCMMYSGDAALIAEGNPEVPIGYFIPEEGATIWVDSFCISRDTTRVENAHVFIDFMLEARSAAASANFLRYASPNQAATEFIEADLLADETINPRPEVLAKCSYFNLKDVESKRMVNVGWRRVMNAWYERSGQTSASPTLPGDETPEADPAAGSN